MVFTARLLIKSVIVAFLFAVFLHFEESGALRFEDSDDKINQEVADYFRMRESGNHRLQPGLGKCETGSAETAAQKMWKTLKAGGVEHVFGLGGGNVINFLRQKPDDVKWTNVGHEDMNGFVAQSYGTFLDVPGVLVTTHGPGAAVATNSLYNSRSEVKPLLHIHQFKEDAGAMVFQQWNVKTILSAMTKLVYYLKDPNDAEQMTREALDAARKQRTLSVLLVENSLWPCCQLQNKTYPKSEYPTLTELAAPNGPILSAPSHSNTLFVIGGSMTDTDRKVVTKFLQESKAAYVSTFKSRVNVGANYFGRLGNLGDTTAHYALAHARHVIILNPESGGLGTASFYGMRFGIDEFLIDRETTVVQVTDAVAISDHCFYTFAHIQSENKVVSDLGAVLKNFAYTADEGWINQLNAFKQSFGDANAVAKSELEKYVLAAAQIHSRQSPGSISVTTGVGNHWYTVGKYFDVLSPAHYYSPTNWGSIGVALPNAVGLYYATKRHVWAFEGDGGAAFSASVFAYLLSNPELPITVHVFVDSIYAAVQTAEFICTECRQPHNLSTSCAWPTGEQITKPTANDVQAHMGSVLHQALGVYQFSTVENYTTFLESDPAPARARVLFINLKRTTNEQESMVYEININGDYKRALLNNNVTAAKHLAADTVLFFEDSN